ncbi:hypothetical protein H6F76_02995 [Leptolyngbya sp. FACHB-321]|uniref:hypothetical protein n=1 Tax=Leptolyngbya sp. FACHB-321 TaxID=2692807 RepID=UPI0016830858|nr:hypothetical protein [Leptolyngbya sp. FACHB-321]MBD2034017.1 hypothetical protein [Leptolyngbya sp. FACHB-321]
MRLTEALELPHPYQNPSIRLAAIALYARHGVDARAMVVRWQRCQHAQLELAIGGVK